MTVCPMNPLHVVEGGVSIGLCPGTTSRGSPTLAGAALSITLLKPMLVICLCGSSRGPNPLDEEAAVNSTMGRSSLTSGFTISKRLVESRGSTNHSGRTAVDTAFHRGWLVCEQRVQCGNVFLSQ